MGEFMNNGDLSILVALLFCGVSVWVIILFVRMCGRVKAIKAMLMAAYDLEESKDYGPFGGSQFRRRKQPQS